MKGVGIIPNWEKKNTTEVVARIESFFEEVGVSVVTMEKEYDPMIVTLSKKLATWRDNVDMIIVVGGDGTILRVARELACWGLPILGINVGHKGFLAEIEADDLPDYLEPLISGDYSISERIMLDAYVVRKERTVAEFIALNDVAATKGPFSRIIRIDSYIGDDFFESYTGDGVIISTPTGSTGYSLSAGGPIVSPALDVLVLTPVCPHSLYNRSVIVDGSELVSLTVYTWQSEIVLTVDGQVGFELSEGDQVNVSKSPYKTSLVTFKDRSFYQLLGRKLKE